MESILFSFQTNLLNFQNPYEFKNFFFTFMKIQFLKKIQAITLRSITRKILVCDIKSCDKDISKIFNVTFTFKIKKKKISNTLKKN